MADEPEVGWRYSHLLAYVRDTPWAITSEMMEVVCDVLLRRAAGENLSRDEIRSRIGALQAAQTGRTTINSGSGAIAVLPIRGVIMPRADMFSEVSGATSLEKFRARFRDALADDSVSSILLDIDSPGGSVDLVEETTAEILNARGKKPITAIANTMAASAAYWIAAAADELVITPSGGVGSVGVFAAHEDMSTYLEKKGVKTTLISAGKYKTEGNPFGPLSEQALEAMQARVNEYYGKFVRDVAAGRGISENKVRNGFGEGRVVSARAAMEGKMVDRIATFEDTVRKIRGERAASKRRASAGYGLQFI